MYSKKTKKGFTIVELVIVIAVIAILAAVLIPTFSSLVKKANMSADQQAVKQMNTILQAEESTDGKPATVVDAKTILSKNGIGDFVPMEALNTFVWSGSDNRVMLWTWDNDEKAAGKITYPENLAKKYADYTTFSTDWYALDAEDIEVITLPSGATAADLRAAVKNASDYAIIILPKGETIDMGAAQMYFLASDLTKSGGTGKHITLDLNDGKITSNTPYYTQGYFNLTVPAGGSLTFVDGSLDITSDSLTTMALSVDDGASLILRDVDMKTNGSALYPSSTASEVIVEGSNIIAEGAYGIATNRLESHLVKIRVKDSLVQSNYSTGMLVNTPSDVYIENSTIVGVVHALALRAGSVEISNSTLKTTETVPGIYSYKNFAPGYNFRGYWKTGNTLPAGTLVVGDNADSDSYSGDAVVTMTNTTIESAAPGEIPEILLAAGRPGKIVNVTYNSASNVGNCVVYGTDYVGDGTIVHNGTMTVNGTEVKLG